jgi:hypothetical protein
VPLDRCTNAEPCQQLNYSLDNRPISATQSPAVFAQLIVKLCAQLRLRLDIDLGRPNIPDLRQCRFVEARGVKGPAFPFPALTGPAFMIVPGAGYGPAILNFGGPGVASLGLTTNPMQVPADKSTIKTLLALGGSLQMLQAAPRSRVRTDNGERMAGSVSGVAT